ncbi:hypothetical protein P152DRAFT_458658, partial [Eremomyces bilateralis CBS 781.70]
MNGWIDRCTGGIKWVSGMMGREQYTDTYSLPWKASVSTPITGAPHYVWPAQSWSTLNMNVVLHG